MIVHINTFFALSIHEKTAFIYEHTKWMPIFFQNKDFGASVYVIAMGAVADTDEQLQCYGFGRSHSRKGKSINVNFQIDFAYARDCTNSQLLSHLEVKIYEEIAKFDQLKLKDFDQHAFLMAMKDFFQIIKTTEPNKLSKRFEDFNDEVRDWQEKKVNQFLKSK